MEKVVLRSVASKSTCRLEVKEFCPLYGEGSLSAIWLQELEKGKKVTKDLHNNTRN